MSLVGTLDFVGKNRCKAICSLVSETKPKMFKFYLLMRAKNVNEQNIITFIIIEK